ncbi:MAG TPA: hypothetical protein VFD70_23130 [Anaerolineae bacterium]|nr:hypothetical protein [Anaerolineae bacterium]
MDDKSHKLEELWERAIQHAVETMPRATDLGPDLLNHAAGLQVKAGVQAGAWTHTCSCQNSCGCLTPVQPC